jgi:predicted ATP-binding protein involved in virulence
MKIKNINIRENNILKNLKINFIYEGKILNTVVIAGINGSGKTTLLKYIFDYFHGQYYNNLEIAKFLEFDFEKNEEEITYGNINNSFTFLFSGLSTYHDALQDKVKYNNYIKMYENLKILPKIIYVPTELNFSNITTKTDMLVREYRFLNIVDNNFISNIGSYIASMATNIRNSDENLTWKEVKEKVSKEINDVFSILDLDIQLIGLSKDERNLPLFKNSFGDEFDINYLSSGEKQLFIRTLAIKMLEPVNSIILIDEPEISLHPKWQQKILEVYQKIGKNNQIIVATHSPHIIGSVPKENLVVLTKEKEQIKAIKGEDIDNTYGQPVNRILEDIMGLETTRHPEIFKKLEDIRQLVREYKYNTDEFKEKYNELKDILGAYDEDLLLIDMDIEIKRGKRGE